jgi:hypothetical protein
MIGWAIGDVIIRVVRLRLTSPANRITQAVRIRASVRVRIRAATRARARIKAEEMARATAVETAAVKAKASLNICRDV